MKTLNKIIVALFLATSSFSQNKDESFDLIKKVNEEIDKLHEELGVKSLNYFSFKTSKPKDTNNVYYQNFKKKFSYQFTDKFYNDLVKFYKRDRYFRLEEISPEYSYTCFFQLFDDENYYNTYYEKHKNDRDYLNDICKFHANLSKLFKFEKITKLDQLNVGDKILSLWRHTDDSLYSYLGRYPVYIYGNSQILKSFRLFDEKFYSRGYFTKIDQVFRSDHVYYIYKIVELNERYSIYFVTASRWNDQVKYRLYFDYFVYDKELNYISDIRNQKLNPKDTLGFTELSFHLKCYGIELYKASYTGDYIPNEISYNKDIENKENEEKLVVKKQKTNKNNLKVNINKFKN
jgi:hypothetical protein